jgi:hypothetical protein
MRNRNSTIGSSGVSRSAVDWVMVALFGLFLALIVGVVLWLQYSTVATTV